MLFFVNPHRGARAARSVVTGPVGGLRMARILPPRDRYGRFVRRGRARRNDPDPDPARRRRRRYAVARRNDPDPEPARRRRRSYRRNPRFDLMGSVMGGVQHGLAVLAGDGLSGALVGAVKLTPGTPLGATAKAAAGVLLGLVAEQAGLRRFADTITAGAFAGAIRPFVVRANIPLLSAGLADYPELQGYVMEQPTMGELPMASTQQVDIYGTSATDGVGAYYQ
jgi:hypothetical protein